MDNFDQLDVLIKENKVLIQHVILFVISFTLIVLICSLIFALINRNR
ncbi:unknown [Choristoneura occidentalis granulovirus]|uniref:Uncharacterized protein n=2 Tax=Betabaculovirus chofumiferanae TaxID=3051997 RepID=Q8B583_GVCF|nr:unknown [Choristoneura fumiferana granulovirus]AAN77196.1 unknown [Choristoneura fumiferana granulovirus]ABC61175.1 unknown [Choristoneura fumiferana granulovirus]